MSGQNTGTHVLRVELDGEYVRLRVECRADVGTDCRLVCAEDCDAETRPCYSYDDDGTVPRMCPQPTHPH